MILEDYRDKIAYTDQKRLKRQEEIKEIEETRRG